MLWILSGRVAKPPKLLLLTRLASKPHQAKDVPVVEAWSSPLKKFWPRAAHGIASASSAMTAPKLWIQLLLATVLIVMFTARLATARNGDLTVMVSHAAVDSYKLMVYLKTKFLQIVLSTIPILLPSRLPPAKVAHAVAVWSLLLNNNWPKELCGTRSASTAPSATVP